MAPPPPHLRAHRALVIAAAIAALLGSRGALAQGLVSRFSIRAEVGAGSMLPRLQRDTLGYDSAHAQVTGRVGFDVVDWLSLQVSVNNGFFVAGEQQATGRTLALQLGLRFHPAVRAVGRAWGDLNPGYYSTGTDRSFGLDAGLGFEFNAGRAVALGPFARLHWIPADTTIHQASDALYLSFGLSLTLRVPPRPAPVARDRDRDGVPDGGDRCPLTSRGARPDPARRGCPMPDADADADGVDNAEDQCVTVPVGSRPDPARRGCPLPDQDGDGVVDPDDACPTTPGGDHPDPARRGCPLGDRDGDAILDDGDQCPTEPQGPRPDPARRGCPTGDRDQDGLTDDADRCPDQAETFDGRDDADGCPDGAALGTRAGGRIRISEQIRFRTDSAIIHGRRSFAIIDAVANVMRASPDIVMLHVEGHTDDRGNPDRNRELSNRRAGAVIRELTARGIAASRLTAHGYGPDRPLDAGSARRNRAANRRIEFRADLDGATAPPAAPTPAPPTTSGVGSRKS